MELRPATSNDAVPAYPPRPKGRLGLGGRLRRLAAAAGAAAALTGVGCNGLPGGEVEVASPGYMAAPAYFVCADEPPEHFEPEALMDTTGTFEGFLCGPQTTYGQLEVDTPVVAEVSLSSVSDGVSALFVDPGGEETAILTPERSTLTIAFEPGTWTVTVDSDVPDDSAWFSLSVFAEP